MNRFLIFVSLIVVGLSTSLAQKPYELLWEVRAPGQAQPSYLFGTMHISEERVYDLPDSVLLALKSCDWVALEADLDSACYGFFDYFFGQGEHSISELDDFERKLTRPAKRRDIGELLNDPEKLKRAIEEVGTQEKEVPENENELHFLDAFLYRLALENDKKVIGLEQMKDQIYLLFDPKSELFSLVEEEGTLTGDELRRIYYSGDVRRIGQLLDEGKLFGPVTKEILIDKRNKVMAQGADSLMRLRPTFVAVGAAHLPGRDGILSLLKTRGYQVRPVVANKNTGIAKAAHQQPYTPKWTSFRSDAEGYSLDLPNAPYALHFTDLPIPMYAGIDFAGGWMYYFMTVPIPDGYSETDRAEMADGFFENFGNKHDAESEPSPVKVGELTGKEVFAEEKGSNLRIRVLHSDKMMYILMAGVNQNVLRMPAVERMFNSLKTHPPVALAHRTWETRTDVRGGFSMAMPAEVRPRYTPHEELPDYKDSGSWSYLVEDALSGQEFLMFSFVLPPTYFYDSVNLAFNDLVANMAFDQLDVLEETPWDFDGYAGMKAKMQVNYDHVLHLKFVIQANRLVIVGVSAEEGDADAPLLQSKLDEFKLLPLQHSSLSKQVQAQGFSAQFPAVPHSSDDVLSYAWYGLAADSIRYWEARDPKTSYAYVVNQAEFGDMVRVDSLAELFRTVHPRELGYKILHEQKVQVPNASAAWECAVLGPDQKTHIYTRFIVHGRYLYALQVNGLPEDGSNVRAFFDGFRLDPQVPAFDWTGSKLARILEGVQSPDTAVSYAATNALSYYRMTPEDQALAIQHIDRQANADSVLPHLYELVDVIATYPQAGSNLALRGVYKNFQRHPDFQAWVLGAMILTDTLEVQQTAIGLLKSSPPQGVSNQYRRDVGYSILQAMSEAQDGMAFYDQMAFLMQNPEWQGEFFFLSFALSTFGELEMRHLGQFRGDFQKHAEKWIQERRRDADEPGVLSRDYQYLLFALSFSDPDEQSFALIRRMMDMGDLALEEYGVVTLLEADLKVEKARMKHLLDTPGYRYNLMDWLLSNEQSKRVPAKYMSPERLAYADLEYYFLDYYGELPLKMELHEKRSIIYQQKRQEIYVFKVGFKEERSWKIAFAGPVPQGSELVGMGFSLTGTDDDDWSPSESELRRLIRDWIESHEEQEEDEEEFYGE